MTTTRGFALTVIVLLGLVPASAWPAETLVGHLEREVVIAPGKFEEPCLPMLLADRLEYSFKAELPLDFNIHYHEGEEIYFPVDLKQQQQLQAEYFAAGSRQYCLMWTNRGETAATLRYSYRLLRNEESP